MAETLYLADKIVDEIKTKVKAVDYIDECYGKVQILAEMKEGKEYVYPAYYVSNGGHLNLMPDASLGNYGFIIVKDPYSFLSFAKNKINKLKANFSLVVWFDSRSTTNSDIRNAEEMKQKLINALGKSTYTKGSVELTDITEDRKEVYKEFTSRDIKDNYLMYPYIAIRINGIIYFEENCSL